MTRELLQQVLDALEAALSDDQPYIERGKASIAALRSALAAPPPEPVAWYRPSPDGDDSIFRDHRTVVACTGNKWEGFLPLYAAPPATPAPAVPAVCDGGTCGLGGYCANCPKQSAAPAVREPQDERAAFEAWLNPGGFAGNISPWVEPGGYEKEMHQMAWLAWQACSRGIGGGGNG